MTYDASKVAFVDTETTGLDPDRHDIWEVAVILPDDDTEVVWQQAVDATQVDQWVLDNTGFRSRYDRSTAVMPQEGIARFGRLTEGRHLVGACPWFDSERLHRLWRPTKRGAKRQHPWHYHLIDVETLVVGSVLGFEQGYTSAAEDHPGYEPGGFVTPGLPWDSDELSRLVGVDPEQFDRHTALGDARWAKALFEAVMGRPSS
jgi:DNA polymerase III epsilon subunit-like protein